MHKSIYRFWKRKCSAYKTIGYGANKWNANKGLMVSLLYYISGKCRTNLEMSIFHACLADSFPFFISRDKVI